MFKRFAAYVFAMVLLLAFGGTAGAGTTGTADGTYDFGSIGAANSGGAGFKTQGDKFKVSNALVADVNPYSAPTDMYVWDTNGQTPGATATIVIKAEGGATNKRFSLKDMNFSTSWYQASRSFDVFTLVVKDYTGSTIATHALPANSYLNTIPDNPGGAWLSTLAFASAFPAAGYDNVAEIHLTWHFDAGAAPGELNIASIKLANVSNTLPAPTVTTQAASALAATSATGNGNITATNGATATARGVVHYPYTNTDLVIGGVGVTNVAESGSFGTGAFTAALTGLAVNTQYNARAHASSIHGTGYGARVAFWTLANVPSAPTVNNATGTTLDVAVNANGNPAGTEFCMQETSTGNHVQAGGALGTACVWQTAAIWGTKTVTGLNSGTTYTFQIKARNGGLTETAYGAIASGVPVTAPTVTVISPDSGPATGGTHVTITGTNLTGASAVTIGGAAATAVTVVNATTITATTPSGAAGAQEVVVTTPGGSGTGMFTYVGVPQMNLKQGVTSIADGGSHGFGSKMVSSNTDTVFTIENSGTAALNVTTPISIGGANADQFSIQAQPTTPVSPSGSTTFTVRFTPTTAGAKTASISIANNDTSKNPYDVTLTGTGTPTTFSLSYDGNGQTSGSAPSDATAYAPGASATVLGNTGSLVKTGYTFVGWNLASNASGTHYAVGASYTITSNTTLYAQWLGTPSATAASSVTLTGFTANWGSVAGATGYRLDVATDSGFGNMVVGFNDLDVGGLTSQALTGLPSGTTYHYRVRAYNGTSTSASSNTISVTTGTSRIVTNTLDSGAGSLRQTIADANPGDTVTFAGGVSGTITLTAPLSIAKDLTITGPGAAVVTVSGANAFAIFQVPGASTFTLQNLTLANGAAVGGAALLDNAASVTLISGCVFTGNSALGGGAILSSGTLTIGDSTFSGNSASGLFGGAIMASGGGAVAISNSLFSGNSAPAGGAIANGALSMSLSNVTLSGNTATTGGGAIYASNGSSLDAVNTTIANNSTAGDGGGILAASGGLVNLKNSIVASNTAGVSGPDIAGTLTSQGYNLIGSTSGTTITGVTTGNLTSVAALLGALANNGGTTQTLALLAGSPAINAGTCTGAPTTDQRGMARPQNSACDIGAYERGAPAALTATAGTPQTTAINTAFATALAARVVDSLGVALDGESVTFAGPGSGASIAAGGSANTNASGIASFSATANATGGSYAVTATIHALSASFNLTNSVSSNANLSALVLSSGTLTPVFAPATTSYTAAVGNAVASITVTPTLADSTASVTVNSVTVASGSASAPIALAVGVNTITVLVTAQDASTQTYTVVVTRASPPDTTPPTLSAVGVSGTTQTTTTLSATSDEAATGYWIVVARSATAPTSAQVTAGVAYAGVTVVAFGTDTMTAALAKTFAVGGLTAGTSYDLYVVAQDSSGNISTPPNQVQFATQSVVLSSNANLSALVLSRGTLTPVFAAATTSYTAAVANAVTSITVTPTVADSTASVKVNSVTVASGSASGAIALQVGPNTITVVVTAQDSSTKTYTVVVTRSSGEVDPPPPPFVPGLYPTIAGMSCLPSMLNVVGGDGPTLFAGMVAVLSNAVGMPLRYAGQSPTGAVVLTGYNGGDLAYVPIAFQSGDRRGDGVFAQDEGQYHIVSNAVALTVAPTLVRLDHFTSIMPAGTSVCMTDTGVLWAALGGTTYVVRPGIAVQRVENPGPPYLALGAAGHHQFTDGLGNRQTLYPAFLEPYTLWTYLRMIDPSASMQVQPDGTVLARVHGGSYTLVPDLTLGGTDAEHAGQSWWQDGENRYRMRIQQRFNVSQGFTVR